MNKKFTLLYVDDEEINLRLFRNLFKRDYNVLIATSAMNAMPLFESESVDMVLSDQRMPDTTGVEFLQQIHSKAPDTIRFLVTGYTDFSALKDGVNDAKINKYVQKPWSDTDFRNVIKDTLSLYALEKENKKLNSQLKSSNIELENKNIELEIAHKKSKESDRLKSAFLSNISHEIRTPLNGILGFSEVLSDIILEDEEINVYKDILINCSTQLLSIITDIIEISRIEAEELTFSNEKVMLNSKLLEVCSQLENVSKEKGLDIIRQFSLDDNYFIYTDHDKFVRIVENLLQNAINFTEHGEIQISYEIEDSMLKVVFKDTGIGISKEAREKIFQSFFQEDVSNTRAVGGLGLGLSIVRSYVKAIGGEIGLESEKGKGSIFWFTCPCIRTASHVLE